MDIKKLRGRLYAKQLSYASYTDSELAHVLEDAITALSTLQARCKDMDCQLEEFSRFLCNQTGGLLSKTNYSAETMISYAEDYQQRVCNDSCDLRAEFEQVKANYDRYKSHVERLLSLPDCNTCDSKDCCAYCPDIGAFTRINCPLWRGQKGGLT